MKKILLFLFICFAAQGAFAQYYQSTDLYQERHNSAISSGWEYYGNVYTYVSTGNSISKIGDIAIYFRNMGNRTVLKASDGSAFYDVYSNPDFGNPKSPTARLEFFVVIYGGRRYFNL